MSNKEVAVFEKSRLPYHPGFKEAYGIDNRLWRVIVGSVFPHAESPDAVLMAFEYCKARGLDVLKRPVNIVPMWDSKNRRKVETVWPGISELRTTAFRTGDYAGRDEIELGEILTEKIGETEVTFPEWGRITVYRMVAGHRCAFVGPKVYWKELYSKKSSKTLTPNSRWQQAPFGQHEKCVEAAALRAAFPEELGNQYASEEMEGKYYYDNEPVGKPTKSRIESRLKEKNGSESPESDEPEKVTYEPPVEEVIHTGTDGVQDENGQPDDEESQERLVLKEKRQEIANLMVKFQAKRRLKDFGEILQDCGFEQHTDIDSVDAAVVVVEALEANLAEASNAK